jgi:hypothetical protein
MFQEVTHDIQIAETIKAIEYELSKHDFYYEKSDDQKEWRSGQYHKDLIIRLMRRVPTHKLIDLMKVIPNDLRMSWAICLALTKDKIL